MCKCMKRKFDGSESELGEDTWRGEKGVGSSMERSVPLVVEGDDWGVEGFGGGFHLVRDPGFFLMGEFISLMRSLCCYLICCSKQLWYLRFWETLERERERERERKRESGIIVRGFGVFCMYELWWSGKVLSGEGERARERSWDFEGHMLRQNVRDYRSRCYYMCFRFLNTEF